MNIMKPKGKKKKPAAPKKKVAPEQDSEVTSMNPPLPEDDADEDSSSVRQMVSKQNKKKKKSGGFQSMGLDASVLRGVLKCGYRVPTPIQRKAIPLALEGRDVVAMARTGSGKTAAFLVPLFQRLKVRSARAGARALVLSPTKELAVQTRKFCLQLGRFTGLRTACVLGGESMERQFALMHENPDIVIATPGRFVHVCVEMGLKLDSVEYVVFDEADRLFEMGFGEQLREILGRLPGARQTLLFSATLPKLLVEFARAGLSDPTLVRLDVETKIPETLRLAFLRCRPEARPHALLHLLERVVPRDQQAVVFCATRHHVEYLQSLLQGAGEAVGGSTYIYSHLDPAARKINAAKFAAKKSRVLLVTDLAARGIDMPFLDNVINYHFPSQAKLFVHRVGRVARAGRSGTAYSLVAGDELAYFIDLQLFLGNAVKTVPKNKTAGGGGEDADWHNLLGEVPQSVYDDYSDQLQSWHENSLELSGARDVADRGYVKYLKSRPGASAESAKRSKKMSKGPEARQIGAHPIMLSSVAETGGESSSSPQKANNGSLKTTAEAEEKRAAFLEEMKKFRPQSTIFEIGNTAKSSQVRSVMTVKRGRHDAAIQRRKTQEEDGENGDDQDEEQEEADAEKMHEEGTQRETLQESTQEDIAAAFGSSIVQPKAVRKAKVFKTKKRRPASEEKRSRKIGKDEENYIGYVSRDHDTEAGYSLMRGFEAAANSAALDLTGDDDDSRRAKKNVVRWDARKKKYVRGDASESGPGGNKKRIKTESGVWIPASYKSDRYARWKERSNLAQMQEEEEVAGDEGESKVGKKRRFQGLPSGHPAMKKARAAGASHPKGPKRELKRPEEVLKQRKAQDKMRQKNMKRKKKGGKRK